MDKLKMQSNNLVEGNIEKIKQLFPNCITEAMQDGKLTNVVDFDLLRQELSSVLVEGKDERYRLDWAGKRQAILTANSPIAKTLRPCREESVNFDTTENLYIEGDNLDVLKLLHETYLNKVKMIYIDPPYNTGNDFVYNDNFAVDAEEYLVNSNQKDEQGNRMETNKETSGRYHSDWLSMMYMRLKLAKDLLTDDGVIFISIDDNEQTNLKKLGNEIFGEQNFIGQAIRRTINSGKHDTNTVAVFHEYVQLYAKNVTQISLSKKAKTDDEKDGLYKEKDQYEKERGRFYVSQLNKSSIQYSDSLNYPIPDPNGVDLWPGEGFEDKGWCWRWGKEKLKWGIDNDYIVFKQQGEKFKVYAKSYEFRDNNGEPIKRTNPYSTLEFVAKEYGNFNATPELSSVFEGKKFFDFPKSVVFVKELLKLANIKDGLIMDFFSGSATTAHATMQLNAEDGGNRKYIMVQLPELTDERSEAHKAGYKNICEIGKERIRRAGKKIDDENRMTVPNLDIGFRVLKLDDSNMKDTFYNSKEYTQEMLLGLDSSIKEDRTAEDILFQVMLDKGVPLSSKIELRECEVGSDESGDQNSILSYYVVGETDFGIIDLICCLDKQINTDAVKEIAKLQPECCVFLDSGMENDATRTNIQQVFDTYSPKTKVEVL